MAREKTNTIHGTSHAIEGLVETMLGLQRSVQATNPGKDEALRSHAATGRLTARLGELKGKLDELAVEPVEHVLRALSGKGEIVRRERNGLATKIEAVTEVVFDLEIQVVFDSAHEAVYKLAARCNSIASEQWWRDGVGASESAAEAPEFRKWIRAWGCLERHLRSADLQKWRALVRRERANPLVSKLLDGSSLPLPTEGTLGDQALAIISRYGPIMARAIHERIQKRRPCNPGSVKNALAKIRKMELIQRTPKGYVSASKSQGS